MRRMRLSLVAMLVMALFVTVLSGCLRKGIVSVNGEKVAKDEFYNRLQMVPVQTVKDGRQVTVPAGQYVMEQIITEKLLQQLAKKEGCAATKDQVETKLNYLKKSSGGAFLAQLRQQGITKDQWETQMMLQQSIVNLITKGSKVSDDEVKKAYDQAIAANPSPFKRPEQAEISVIIAKDQAKIQKAYKMLQDGQDFGTVAMSLSEDRTSAQNQGLVGWLSMNMQPVPMTVRQLSFATQVGKFSQPAMVKDKNSTGWVIVKVNNRRKATTQAFADVKDVIKEQLAVRKADRKAFDKEFKDFMASSKMTVNTERYKSIPEMMKKNAGVPSNLDPGNAATTGK